VERVGLLGLIGPIGRPPDNIGVYHWPVPTRRGWLTGVALLALPALALSGCGNPTATAKVGSTSTTRAHASVPTTTTVPPTTTTTVPPLSGSISPGDGPWTYTAPVLPAQAQTLVCAFNGGFQMADAHGGYYTEGRVIVPLVSGAASLVITQDGTVTVGEWGRDLTMTPDVIAVRQNLTLLVDNGAPVPGLDPNDTSAWGSALGGVPQVYRSGAGVTADGALVYVSGPSLNVPQLADLLE
jgi:Phosphodiester glycosidase